MNKRRLSLVILLCCLFVLPAAIGQSACVSPAPGITQVDLTKVFNQDQVIEGAWMLDESRCLLLTSRRDTQVYGLSLFNLNSCQASTLSTLPQDLSFLRQRFSNGQLQLHFQPLAEEMVLVVTVDQAGKVATSKQPGGVLTLQEAWSFRSGDDGSLVFINPATGQEEELVQGLPSPYSPSGAGASYEDYLAYQPHKDEIGFDGGVEPFLSFPVDKATFAENQLWFWRSFYPVLALDEYRLVYVVMGWEWGAGFGVYDMGTLSDHRITGRGYFHGLAGNRLIGTYLMADLVTYQTSHLPQVIQNQLAEINAMEDGFVISAFSPNGDLIALAGLDARRSGEKTLLVSYLTTGKLLHGLDFSHLGLDVMGVSFYTNSKILLNLGQEDSLVTLLLIDLDALQK